MYEATKLFCKLAVGEPLRAEKSQKIFDVGDRVSRGWVNHRFAASAVGAVLDQRSCFVLEELFHYCLQLVWKVGERYIVAAFALASAVVTLEPSVLFTDSNVWIVWAFQLDAFEGLDLVVFATMDSRSPLC